MARGAAGRPQADQPAQRHQGRPAADAAAMIAALVLLAACVHEFAWQLFTFDLQGDVRAVTQWPLIASLCWALWRSGGAFDRAAAIAVGIMSLTTAACSLAWLLGPFETIAGNDQCSAHWGSPMLPISAAAACVPLIVGSRGCGK